MSRNNFKNANVNEKNFESVNEENVEIANVIDGIVTDCAKLNVRQEPNVDSDIVTVINVGTRVIVDEDSSTDDFYKIVTASSVEGFCMKDYIEIQR